MTDLIGAVRTTGSKIEVEAAPELTSRFVSAPFFAEYDDSVDLGALPETITLVPFLLNIAPVVWVSRKRYEVAALDAGLAASFEQLREVFRRAYPELAWDGEIVAGELVAAEAPDGSGAAGLFSGGVDSVYSALAADPQPSPLITVWGADINLSNETGGRAILSQAQAFAASHGRESVSVRSNLRQFLNGAQLNYVARSIPGWWAFVQHGMGLLGLTAPILASRGLSRIVIAATHTEDFDTPWGSSPQIDTLVSWGGVQAGHHGHDASRQEKLRFISRLGGADPPDWPQLRACYAHPDGSGGNCGRCEKCLRTATGLLIEGREPTDYGFPLPAEAVADEVRSAFGSARLEFEDNQLFMWQDIQKRARERSRAGDASGGGVEAFVDWLIAVDFEDYRRHASQHGRLGLAARRMLARVPPAQRAAKRLLQR